MNLDGTQHTISPALLERYPHILFGMSMMCGTMSGIKKKYRLQFEITLDYIPMFYEARQFTI